MKRQEEDGAKMKTGEDGECQMMRRKGRQRYSRGRRGGCRRKQKKEEQI